MKTFNQFVTNLTEEDIEAINLIIESNTENNEQRKKALEKWLKGKKLPNYIASLNKMLDDNKAKALLKDGFGGELGDVKLDFKEIDIPVGNLRATQGEIDVSKSIDYALKKPENIDTYYKNNGVGVMIANFPIITFRQNYVIDGHHRWSQVFAWNPDAKIKSCDYNGNISAIQMLKATQGAIGAVKADDNDNNGKIPAQEVHGKNLFDDSWNRKAIIKHVKELAVPSLPTYMKKYHPELDTIDKIAEFVADNLIKLKSNNYPEDSKNAPSRGYMPQTDEAGTKEGDTKTALPNSKGSALNKLKDGKIVGKAIQ